LLAGAFAGVFAGAAAANFSFSDLKPGLAADTTHNTNNAKINLNIPYYESLDILLIVAITRFIVEPGAPTAHRRPGVDNPF